MYTNTPKQKRTLKIVLFIYLCFMTISGSVFYMYGKQASIESAFIRSQKTEVNQSNDGVLLDSVLGDYDSIDLQEQPKAQTDPTNIDTPETQQQVSSPVAISKNEVYALINSYRKQHGLSEVSIDERLETSSMNKAQDMVKNNYFEHKNPWGFINGAGYTFSYAAENLAIVLATIKHFWMKEINTWACPISVESQSHNIKIPALQ